MSSKDMQSKFHRIESFFVSLRLVVPLIDACLFLGLVEVSLQTWLVVCWTNAIKKTTN